jgi:succinate dehydrogenase hydrophobic anchor subunit
MSVHPTTLARQMSATWLRNAFSGLLAVLILAFFLILLP